MNKKKLIVISAPSGAGKTTLCRRLLADFPELMLSISTTTRSPRGQEKNGREYFFTAREDFEAMIHTKQFAEWAMVHGNYYGTSKASIEAAFAQGKAVLLDIDVQGAAQLMEAFPTECYTLFWQPPSMQELEARLRGRKTDSEESIQKRLVNARLELEASSQFHQVIVNDELEAAYEKTKALVEKALHG